MTTQLIDRIQEQWAQLDPVDPLRTLLADVVAVMAAPQPAQDQGLIATLAGLEASTGHLSAIVDQQRALLAEVEDAFGRDERGIPFEDGESRLIDKVRAHLACIAAPQAPQPAQKEPANLCPYTEDEDGKRDAWIEGWESAQTAALAAPQPAQEPVAEVAGRYGDMHIKFLPAGMALQLGDKLYAAPPQRQPLTDGEILAWWSSENGLEDCDMAKRADFVKVVRAVEARITKGPAA